MVAIGPNKIRRSDGQTNVQPETYHHSPTTRQGKKSSSSPVVANGSNKIEGCDGQTSGSNIDLPHFFGQLGRHPDKFFSKLEKRLTNQNTAFCEILEKNKTFAEMQVSDSSILF